jgi:MIP family channel proteins
MSSPAKVTREDTVVIMGEEKQVNVKETVFVETIFDDLVKAFAEFIGTLFFIFLALTAVQGVLGVSEKLNAGGILAIATSFGLSLAVSIAMVCSVSGGHLNPAVTIALLAVGEIKPIRSVLYIVAQCAGATIGALFAKTVTVGDLLGYNAVSTGISSGSAFFAEALLTSVLVYTVLVTAVDGGLAPGFAPLYIGLSVFTIHIAGIAIDGTSVNPARTFGASLVAGKWADQWVFWAGPIAGGLFAAGVWRTFQLIQKKQQ